MFLFPIKTIRRLLRMNFVRSMANGRLVDFAVDGEGIAIVTMLRPPVNSLNLELLQELSGALDDVTNNKCHAMILTSSIPSVFSSGGDLMEFYKPEMKRFQELWTCFQDVWIKLFGSDFITAAAINGHAQGMGCLLALSCEYRAMVRGRHKIGYTEPLHGSLAPKWFVYTMLNIISNREAERALTTGTAYSVEEALTVGLIDTAAEDNVDAIENCKQFIMKFDNPPQARAVTKLKFREGPLQWMKENRQKDFEEIFAVYNNSPEVERVLGIYANKHRSQNK